MKCNISQSPFSISIRSEYSAGILAAVRFCDKIGNAEMEENGMKQLEKFFYMVRMVFLEKLAYTKALWFDIMATLVYIVIYYFLWQIVFRSQNQLAGFSMMEMTTYIILSRTLAAQFSGGVNRQFAVWIYEGAIGTELQRPVGIFTNLLSRRVGEFL